MLNTMYMTLTASSDGKVDVACSDPRMAHQTESMKGGETPSGFANAALHTMTWDLLAFATIKGCRVGGNVQADRVSPILLIALANAVLDPEQLGFAVTGEVRDMARLALGKPAVESHLCPGWKQDKPLTFGMECPPAAGQPDWSAA